MFRLNTRYSKHDEAIKTRRGVGLITTGALTWSRPTRPCFSTPGGGGGEVIISALSGGVPSPGDVTAGAEEALFVTFASLDGSSSAFASFADRFGGLRVRFGDGDSQQGESVRDWVARLAWMRHIVELLSAIRREDLDHIDCVLAFDEAG